MPVAIHAGHTAAIFLQPLCRNLLVVEIQKAHGSCAGVLEVMHSRNPVAALLHASTIARQSSLVHFRCCDFAAHTSWIV